MSETLKNCPFCGGDAEMEHYPGNEDGPPEAWVRCGNGACKVNPSTFGREFGDAVADWNRRAEPMGELRDDISILNAYFTEGECSKCSGTGFHPDVPVSEPPEPCDQCEGTGYDSTPMECLTEAAYAAWERVRAVASALHSRTSPPTPTEQRERIAQITAHRACCSSEHNPSRRISGRCW